MERRVTVTDVGLSLLGKRRGCDLLDTQRSRDASSYDDIKLEIFIAMC